MCIVTNLKTRLTSNHPMRSHRHYRLRSRWTSQSFRTLIPWDGDGYFLPIAVLTSLTFIRLIRIFFFLVFSCAFKARILHLMMISRA
jgi:hypothetical protein